MDRVTTSSGTQQERFGKGGPGLTARPCYRHRAGFGYYLIIQSVHVSPWPFETLLCGKHNEGNADSWEVHGTSMRLAKPWTWDGSCFSAVLMGVETGIVRVEIGLSTCGGTPKMCSPHGQARPLLVMDLEGSLARKKQLFTAVFSRALSVMPSK